MSETEIIQRIRLKASKLGMILWRNNCGKFQDAVGRWVSYGTGGIGAADLLGGTPIVITPDHVGKTFLVLTAIEVKTASGMKPSGTKAKQHFAEQQRFIDGIIKAGGFGKIICSEDEL